MNRSTRFAIALVVAATVVYAIVLKDRFLARDEPATHTAPITVSFQNKTLQVPEHWHVFEAGTRNGVLHLTRNVRTGIAPTLILVDERAHPEIPAQFVDGWKAAQHLPGFQPRSVEQFNDPAVDAANSPCVAIDWGGTRQPLQLICLSSDGRWKLTLSGERSDIPALDALAQQLPAFEQGQ